MVESAANIARIWVEFPDPDPGQAQVFRCDLTWLTSSWTCIFGQGCAGIYEERPEDGCCTHGAHFTGKADYRRVKAQVAELDSSLWQNWSHGVSPAGWKTKEDGERKTRVVDGACIFLNKPGFAGGAGCALHQLAEAKTVAPHLIKPEVCWQLPIKRTYAKRKRADGTKYLETSIGEFDRASWGAGGHDFDWYCSSDSTAHVGASPVYRSAEAELTELMGKAAYKELAKRCEAHQLAVAALRSSSDGRKLLPLLVHPATLAAQAEAQQRLGDPQ